jgi:hypothetical protein
MWAERALEAWSALEGDAIRTSWLMPRVLEGPGGKRAPLWPLAHVCWAAAEVHALGRAAPIDDLHRFLRPYRSGAAYAATPRGRRYFDDNAWLGLAMLRLGVATGDLTWREHAEELARFLEQGEAPDGGVLWAEGSHARNTCSTASGAWLQLAAGVPSAHTTARRWMVWLDRTLRRSDGLYADNIEDGVVEQRAWTYNQGAALAAFELLGEDATSLRAAILAAFPADVLWSEPPAFAAIAFRALLADRGGAEDAIEVWDPYLERLVAEARDTRTGWYTRGGVGTFDGTPTIDQAAIVEMLALRSRV